MMNKQLAFVKSGLGLALCFLMVGAGVTGSVRKPCGYVKSTLLVCII